MRRVKWEIVVWDFLWVIGTWYAVFELNRSPWWWALCIAATTTGWYEKAEAEQITKEDEE